MSNESRLVQPAGMVEASNLRWQADGLNAAAMWLTRYEVATSLALQLLAGDPPDVYSAVRILEKCRAGRDPALVQDRPQAPSEPEPGR